MLDANHQAARDLSLNDLDSLLETALSGDPQSAREGTRILFREVIEPLGDSFLAPDRLRQERLLARAISRARRLPQASELDARLTGLECQDESALQRRIPGRRRPKPFDPERRQRLKKILVLSRITLGADVLLTSTILEKMRQVFPEAQIIFVGDPKNAALFGSHSHRIRVRLLHYPRRGVLMDRLLSWIPLLDALAEEVAALESGEDFIVINPDSRFLQSGVLPILGEKDEERHYYFWEGSVPTDASSKSSQVEDLVEWLDLTFGPSQGQRVVGPALYLPPSDDTFGLQLFETMELGDRSFVVGMNLGVGGNQEKRIHEAGETLSRFERDLVLKILADGATLILDKGAGPVEAARAGELVDVAASAGIRTLEIQSSESTTVPVALEQPYGLICFQGSAARFASLLRHCHLYLGYDSLGQHLAGALGRDVLAIFAAHSTGVFAQRWQTAGTGNIRTIQIGPGPLSPSRQERLTSEVFQAYRSVKSARMASGSS